MVQHLFSLIDFLFSFQGRISRLAYWAYSIGVWTAIIILAIVMGWFDPDPKLAMSKAARTSEPVLMAILFGVLFIGFMWSTYAVQAKRWHDRDKSGWWSLVGFIPYIGGIWILVECGFLRGTDGANRFGEAPGGSQRHLAEVFE